jgi:hypothetical protein
MKKITTLLMLMIGLSGITTQAVTQATNGDNDLYALVYPLDTGQLSNLYNSDATAQDEIDKFLNNKPSLLDASNPATSGAVGLGQRKLYLYTHDATYGFTPAGSYAYIYYDTSTSCPMIHYSGATDPDNTLSSCGSNWSSISGDFLYKKVLTDSTTATANGWSEMPSMLYGSYEISTGSIGEDSSTTYNAPTCSGNYSRAYMKIKTTYGVDGGGESWAPTLTSPSSLGVPSIEAYKMVLYVDYFFSVYQTSKTA